MLPNIRRIVLPLAALASVAACRGGGDDRRVVESEADSGAIASAAAEAIVETLRGTALSDTAPDRRWLLAPGPTSWDTLLADELRRAEPSIAEEPDDTMRLTTVTTHGYTTRGDTVDVTVVVRSCVRSDTVFNFTKDSQVHRLVRTATTGDAEWRHAGAVTHDHAIGECEPLATPEGDQPRD